MNTNYNQHTFCSFVYYDIQLTQMNNEVLTQMNNQVNEEKNRFQVKAYKSR